MLKKIRISGPFSTYAVMELVFSRSNEPVLPAQASLAESLPVASGVVLARTKCRFKRERVPESPAPLEKAPSEERRTTLFSSMIVVGI